MMKKINEIINKIDLVSEKYKKLGTESMSLTKQKEKEIVKYIIKKNILNENDWEFYNFNLISYMYNFKNLDKMFELNDCWGHGSIYFSKGICLRQDDSDISITFENKKEILPFITKYKLNVNFTDIDKKKKKLEEEINSLEEILNQYKRI